LISARALILPNSPTNQTVDHPTGTSRSAGSAVDSSPTGESSKQVGDNAEIELKLATIANLKAETRKRDAETEKINKEVGEKQLNWVVAGPILATIVVAILGLFSNAYVTYLNSASQLQLETARANTTLIVEAVKTGSADPKVANRNLQFFIDAGLLKDPDGKIANLVKQGRSPVLPAQATPAFRNGSRIPEQKDKKIEVLTDDERKVVLVSPLPPVGFHKVAVQALGTGVGQDCAFGDFRFKCIRLSQTVRSLTDEGAADYVFDRPIPFVAVLSVSPSDKLILGDAVKTHKQFSWDLFDNKAQMKVLKSAMESPGAWTALEPVELVQDGEKALQWMTSSVNKGTDNDCLSPDDGYCARFLFFKMTDDPQVSGIAYCALAQGLEVRSLPIGCEVYALRQDGKWSIRALLSPQYVDGGFGGIDPGLYCDVETKTSLDVGSGIVKAALTSIFDGGKFTFQRRGDKIAIAGVYSGKRLESSKSVVQNKEEAVTFHGLIRSDGKTFSLSGYVAVDEKTPTGQFLELTNEVRAAFGDVLVSRLNKGLSSLGGKIECQDVPYFRWGG
jgi:hypothetical protein